MNADDLQELYKLLRGSRSATMVLDARTLFLERNWTKAQKLLLEAREAYSESRMRLLKQDPDKETKGKGKEADREARRLKRKQEKAREILEAFDELAPQLEKLARREQERAAKEKPESTADVASVQSAPQPPATSAIEPAATLSPSVESPAAESPAEEQDANIKVAIARSADVTEAFASEFRDSSGDERLDVIGRYFGFREVATESDIHSDALYFIRSGEKSFLIRTLDSTPDEVPMASAIDDAPMKPFTARAFIKLGKKRKMVLLTTTNPAASGSDEREADIETDVETDFDSDCETDSETEQNVLDMGAFSQLLTSAQRCGIVPGADRIAHVRDREFRMGNYDLAFQSIDAMYSSFTSNMNQRIQRLTREDADISSGRKKMSPKDLQAKRARDRIETQEVERARRRFQVVLEGLRVLQNS